MSYIEKRLLVIVSALMVSSCLTVENPSFSELANDATIAGYEKLNQDENPITEAWVCHNPTSPHHQSRCVPGCLEVGSENRFCWLITYEDCAEELIYDWQLNACPLLGGE